MKIYEIADEESTRSVGILVYYEKARSFIIELQEYLDEWTAPLLFAGYVKRGIYTIPREVCLMWVKERVIPGSRQNIESILSRHRLREYDEMRFLEISEGRCSHDSLYIRRINKLPEYAAVRARRNLKECVPLKDHCLLCIFCDGTVKKAELGRLSDIRDMDKVLRNEDLYLSCRIGPGGYSATFNDSIDIPASVLYSAEGTVPLCADDFVTFVQRGIVDTAKSCDLLECSRQNLSYMINHEQLLPVKKSVKGNLYTMGDVISNRW